MSEPPIYDGPGYGVCPWPLDATCVTAAWAELDEDVRERATALASSTLHRLTGRRVGGCPVTIRPCVTPSACTPMVYMRTWATLFSPGINAGGAWVNNAGGGCGCTSRCSHNICEVALPTPVGEIYEVMVDGEAVPVDDYRVENGQYLVWQGTGDCPWPSNQDLSLPLTELGTMSVTFLNAYAVDRMGAQAAGTLAWEFAQACAGDVNNCRLPANVVQVVRAGVSYVLAPGLFPDGFTGIDSVDAFITDWNPRALVQGPSVWTPDMEQPRIETYKGPVPVIP